MQNLIFNYLFIRKLTYLKKLKTYLFKKIEPYN